MLIAGAAIACNVGGQHASQSLQLTKEDFPWLISVDAACSD